MTEAPALAKVGQVPLAGGLEIEKPLAWAMVVMADPLMDAGRGMLPTTVLAAAPQAAVPAGKAAVTRAAR